MIHFLALLVAAMLFFLLELPWLGGMLALITFALFVVWAIKWIFNLFDDAAGNDDDAETFDETLTALWRNAFKWKKDVAECNN